MCSQLLGMWMIEAYGLVSAFRYDVGKVAQCHNLGTNFSGILRSMFESADTNNEIGNIVNVGKYSVEDSDLELFHSLSSTACSNFSTNSSTVCNRSFGVVVSSFGVS